MGLEEIARSINDISAIFKSYSKSNDKNQKEQLKKRMLDISSNIRNLMRKQADSLKNA